MPCPPSLIRYSGPPPSLFLVQSLLALRTDGTGHVILPAALDCICNGGFRPFSPFASGHLPYSVDLHRPALCLPLRMSLRNLVYEVTSTSDGCLIFFEGTRRRRGCAEAGGRGRGNILLAELQIHSIERVRLWTQLGSDATCSQGMLAHARAVVYRVRCGSSCAYERSQAADSPCWIDAACGSCRGPRHASSPPRCHLRSVTNRASRGTDATRGTSPLSVPARALSP